MARIPKIEPQPAAEGAAGLTYRSARGRWVLLATVLGSSVAALDSTVVNVALPHIGRSLHVGIAGLQWTVDAYLLTLGGFLLLGGALGDRLGRRKVFLAGAVWFAVASAACAAAPDAGFLVAARAVQGVGGALLTPGSLAIIQASFAPEDRAPAIGAWSGLGGVAIAIGPFLGGWLVEAVSWRAIFLVNLPLVALVVAVSLARVPESRDPRAAPGLDVPGASCAVLGLAAFAGGLTEGGRAGWGSAGVVGLLAGGALLLAALVLVVEPRREHPMLPGELFASRQFVAANAVTFVVYAALGGSTFLLPVVLQRAAGFSPVAAGAALVPVTVLMLLLSPRAGRLANRIGPRLPMGVGPIVAGCGLALLTRAASGGSYAATVLPGACVLGLGLSLMVAPLTATVLAAAGEGREGVASAVNNDVARVAALVAVALLPAVSGVSTAYASPHRLAAAFRVAMAITGAWCAAGGVLALVTIRRAPAGAAPPGGAAGPGAGRTRKPS